MIDRKDSPPSIAVKDRVEVFIKGDGARYGIVRAICKQGYVVRLEDGRRIITRMVAYHPTEEQIAERAARLRESWPDGRIASRSEYYVGVDGPAIKETSAVFEDSRRRLG